ncbi:hypothetical protein HanXRQr2_Chr12g0549511 [Helianthus annuus]|uniref:Uncharacterized protein n=1 Tax=Helianthus annuus TaxID=4232 RepID=A0A251SCF2_HELAN|nr:hypothetical protein HanXRQr2_Chr12g0549511 [Helianthus annuus]
MMTSPLSKSPQAFSSPVTFPSSSSSPPVSEQSAKELIRWFINISSCIAGCWWILLFITQELGYCKTWVYGSCKLF